VPDKPNILVIRGDDIDQALERMQDAAVGHH
jgi:hypothetical protein